MGRSLERERLPTPVFWPGELHGLYSPWGHKESDTTKRLSQSCYSKHQMPREFLSFKHLFVYVNFGLSWVFVVVVTFSSCSSGDSSLVAMHRLPVRWPPWLWGMVSGCAGSRAVASLVLGHGLWVRRLQPLSLAGSAVVPHGLSCSTAGGIFLDQGSNSCPLR